MKHKLYAFTRKKCSINFMVHKIHIENAYLIDYLIIYYNIK